MTHACATLQHCQRCWVDLERGRQCGTIDLVPHRQLILRSAFALCAEMVLHPKQLTLDILAKPHEQLDRALEGKACELAYRVWAGLDPEGILDVTPSGDDADGVDVKQVKVQPGGWSRFTLAEGSWRRERYRPGFRYVGVQLSDDGWKASIVGSLTVERLGEAMRAGLVPRKAGTGRRGGGDWFEVRAHLLNPVAVA